MLDLLTRPRTRVQRATAMLRARRTAGYGPFVNQQILWAAYVMAYGDPTEPRPAWHFQGPRLAEMMSGRRMKIIPRELRRIHAPYP